MKKIKALVTALLVVLGSAVGLPVLSASSVTSNSSAQIIETTYTEDGKQIIEGMVADSDQTIDSKWLAGGSHIRYPSQGGTWEYGFWNAKVRSYYTVNKDHGSTVYYNDNKARSIDTAANKKSIAEKYAINLPGNDDSYYYRIVS